MTHENAKYKYIHKKDECTDGCGKIAFYLKRMPILGEGANTDDMILLNGKQQISNSTIICGNCQKTMWPMFRDNIEPVGQKL